jgi:long-chain fatty acid transport protein
MKTRSKLIAVAIAAAFAPAASFATNGYAPHGIGVRAQGMGGVSTALPQDTMAAAANPANLAFVGNRLDVGLTWFRPTRDAEITGNQGLFLPLSPDPNNPIVEVIPSSQTNGSFDGSGKSNFFIPEFGYSQVINPNMSGGVVVYGSGGMNTFYDGGIPLFGNTTAGVDLMQLFIAPTIAFKPAPNHSIGASLNIVYQRFKAHGLQNFASVIPTPLFGTLQFSESPDNVTEKGYSDSWGWGMRIGWTGEVAPGLMLGASYQTKSWMSSFDEYKGLFAEQGDFDIPQNANFGISWKATPALILAADIQWIDYEQVAAISNPLANLSQQGNLLGSSNGPGFGWESMLIYKLGVSFDVNPQWTLRAGYSYGNQPIPSSETFFNILAPGTIEQHLTLGATWKIDPKQELSFAYMHGFESDVNGSGSIPAAFGGGEANIKMYQDSLGISYGYKF